MDEGFREYLKDGGIRSRKLWITIATIVIISSLGVMWAVYNWQESLFNTITSGLVTLTIGFLGINAGRAALPATAAYMSSRRDKEKEQEQEQVK